MFKDTGDYSIIIEGKDNYTGSVELTFTIEKADSTLNAALAAVTNLIYNGEAQMLVTRGEASGGTMQ